MTSFRRLGQIGLATLLVTLAACSILPAPPAARVDYDLGEAAPDAGPAGTPSASVECSAPEWLSGTALHYRLDYRAPLEPLSYRDSRWVAPPCALLAHRLRAALRAGADPGKQRTLRLVLEEFGQDFESPASSHVTLRVTGTLVTPGATPTLRTRSFTIRLPAPSADARGGVAALATASGQLATQLQDWASQP